MSFTNHRQPALGLEPTCWRKEPKRQSLTRLQPPAESPKPLLMAPGPGVLLYTYTQGHTHPTKLVAARKGHQWPAAIWNLKTGRESCSLPETNHLHGVETGESWGLRSPTQSPEVQNGFRPQHPSRSHSSQLLWDNQDEEKEGKEHCFHCYSINIGCLRVPETQVMGCGRGGEGGIRYEQEEGLRQRCLKIARWEGRLTCPGEGDRTRPSERFPVGSLCCCPLWGLQSPTQG